MSTNVHEALKTLSATHHSEFPSDSSALAAQLSTSLPDVHFLLTSIPPPDQLPDYLTLPEPPNADAATLQKEWKPVKLSAKENPMGHFSVYKLPAKDGGPTWFARRSIHTDISFERFKAGLEKEFHQPQTDGGAVGNGAVRGIGGATRVLYETCEFGKAEIFQLSAQFPGPSAPRSFVEGCLSSSAHLEDLSAAISNEDDRPRLNSGSARGLRPRQFTLISKPVLEHPDCDLKSGFVRGTYESVEYIREIPCSPRQLSRSYSSPNVSSAEALQSQTRPRGNTVGVMPHEAEEASQSCPVDWIQISRSSPGGSVPRWLVDRATPNGMVTDAKKFLVWCRESTHLDDVLDGTVDATEEEPVGNRDSCKSASKRQSTQLAESAPILSEENANSEFSPAPGSNTGSMIYGALGSVAVGMTSLAHSAIPTSSYADYTPPATCPSDNETPSSTASHSPSQGEPKDGSETASIRTFETCESHNAEIPISDPHSLAPSIKSTASTPNSNKSPEERALAQFLKEKQRLEEKLQREGARRAEQDRKHTEKHLKTIEKQEKKYRRALEKANEKRIKDEEKREREAHKKIEREEKGRRNEIEELKRVVEALTKENLELREKVEALEGKEKQISGEETVKAVEALTKENTELREKVRVLGGENGMKVDG